MMENEVRYEPRLDRRTGLYGVKRYAAGSTKAEPGWWMQPSFEALGASGWSDEQRSWFKRDGRFGYVDFAERRELIPAEYSFPPYFSKEGYAVVWKDYRAGVIDLEGNTVIPFVYDVIYERHEDTDSGTRRFSGFACGDEEGVYRRYDENCQLIEEGHLEPNEAQSYMADPANEPLTVVQLEDKIRENFRHLVEMGYGSDLHYNFSDSHRKEMDELEEIVKNAIYDRRRKMNLSWKHDREHAARIARMNDLLMKAVRKAIALGKKTAKSLQWMEKVSNTEDFEVSVYVYPYWQDDTSRYGYVPVEKNRSKEKDRLETQECDESDLHIWNIIARMGEIPIHDGITPCFDYRSHEYDPKDWNYRDRVLDDGQTWDELIHFPAYQDVYFLCPFHHLYCDLFDYSFEDLASINDFRVDVKVTLQTRERDK